MEMRKSDYANQHLTGIDLFKLIAAMLVVMSHTEILTSYSRKLDYYFVNVTFRWCVPFFFIVSGYFMADGFKSLCRYLFRIFLLELLWTILYYIAPGYPMELNWELIRRFFQIGGAIDPFWYLPSLAASMLLVYVLRKICREKDTAVFVIVSILYLFALAGDTYLYAFPDNKVFEINSILWVGSTRNGFLFGSLYIFIGSFLRKNRKTEELVRDIKHSTLVAVIAVSFFYLCLEIFIFTHLHTGIDCNVLVSTVFLATAVFLLSLKFRMRADLSRFCRKMSTLIFMSHYYFVIAVTWEGNSILRFLGILGLSALLSALIAILSERIRFLRYFY